MELKVEKGERDGCSSPPPPPPPLSLVTTTTIRHRSLRASEEKPDLGIVTCDVNAVAAEWILISDLLKRMLLEIRSPEEILRVKED
ncbi:hypothetical protein F2Q70_00027535 [Brassica cretica]|uniref:Uncharacterized protein n=1 Tax=Brassica cretica TaxID=69181 RepID=A0A8S9LBM1_BRACR|nr:hypothetical protein F2Q70_00027535 [Brassica cretica]